MTDVATNEAPSAASRKAVSVRSYIDHEGNEVDRIEEASGAQYEVRGGKTFQMQFGEPGHATTMLGIFGFHTKVGNVVNSVLNAQEAGDANDASEAVEAFLGLVQEGKWAERAAGGGGFAKIDCAKLAEAMTQVAATKHSMTEAEAGEYLQRAAEKLEADKAFRSKVRKDTTIGPIYDKLTGTTRKAANVDDLLAI